MIRKLVSMAACLAFLISMGCAALQKTCQYKEKFFAYKARIGSALATVQAGYPLVLEVVNRLKDNALDPEKVGAGVEAVMLRVQLIDAALDVLGKLYFDNVCPSEEDVKQAEALMSQALAAQHGLAKGPAWACPFLSLGQPREG